MVFTTSPSIISNETEAIQQEFNHSACQDCNESLYMSYPKGLLDFAVGTFVLLTIVGVAGNFISILALLSCKRLRNATSLFIVNLCVADLLFCLAALPQTAVIFAERTWNYGDALCKMCTYIKYANTTVSYWTILAITLNRYILIIHPKLYPLLCRKVYLFILIGFTWVYALTLLMFPLLGVWGKIGYDPKISECTIMDYNGSPKRVLYISFLPYLLFIVCYIRIYFRVRKAFRTAQGNKAEHLPQIEVPNGYRYNKRESQILKITLIIFVSYVLWYFPISYVKIYRMEKSLPGLNVFGYICFFLSHVTNPFIYIILSKEYRKVYKELFQKIVIRK